MIELFRRNLFVNTLLMLPYAIIVRIHSFIAPSEYIYTYSGNNYLLQWFYNLVSSPLLQSVIALLLIYIHAIYLNRISIKHRIPNDFTLFPGILYILLVSISPAIVSLSPSLISMTFIILMVAELFNTYKNQAAATHIFNTGFFACLSFLFNPALIVVFLFGFIGLMILRSFKSIEKLQYLIGFSVPVFLALSGLYFFEVDIKNHIGQFFEEIGLLNFGLPSDQKLYLYLGVLSILFLVTFFNYNRYTIRKSIQAQKKIDLFYWLSFTSIFVALLGFNNPYGGTLLLTISISVLFAMNLTWMKNKLITELIHMSLLAILIYNIFI